jgi:hypothetical protein
LTEKPNEDFDITQLLTDCNELNGKTIAVPTYCYLFKKPPQQPKIRVEEISPGTTEKETHVRKLLKAILNEAEPMM